jgi:hypothetical protein
VKHWLTSRVLVCKLLNWYYLFNTISVILLCEIVCLSLNYFLFLVSLHIKTFHLRSCKCFCTTIYNFHYIRHLLKSSTILHKMFANLELLLSFLPECKFYSIYISFKHSSPSDLYISYHSLNMLIDEYNCDYICFAFWLKILVIKVVGWCILFCRLHANWFLWFILWYNVFLSPPKMKTLAILFKFFIII